MKIEPIILESTHVRLEPMKIEHLESLCEAGLDESLWLLTTVNIKTADDMKEYVRSALEDQKKGVSLPFVTLDKESNKIVGSTRFGNIDCVNRRAEIGWTWISPDRQRTIINSEAKLLMLTHAFETWGCIRVELKTDSLNEISRRAILRIGAKEEGILRNHMITYSGRYRHSVYFSIIESEWPAVRQNLQTRIDSYQ